MPSPSKAPAVAEPALTGMRRTNELFCSEVVGKKNFAALHRVYTAQARALPPGAPMLEGREAIQAFWKQAIAGMNITAAKLAIVEAHPAGDGVVEIGRAELTAGGQMVSVKYVVHWQQEDGAWKWNIDIWNMNQ